MRALVGLIAGGLMVGWMTAPAVAAEVTVARYRCTLADGAVMVLAHDLSSTYPQAAAACQAFEVAALPVMRMAAFASTGPNSGITTLTAPSTAPSTAPVPMPAPAPLVLPPTDLVGLIQRVGQRHGLDPALLQAVMWVESGYRPSARSPKGALGLMQVMPATAARYGVSAPQSLLAPDVNLDVAARYLRDLQRRFHDRGDLVLAAYNAGEGAVLRHGGRVPPYPETQAYVARILNLLGQEADRP